MIIFNSIRIMLQKLLMNHHLEQENLHGITIVNATWGAVGPIKI